MTKAYAVGGFHYCESCFYHDPPWKYESITVSDFPNEPVPCEECEVRDVFDRATRITLDPSDESWLIPWPTKPGYYWFHGWLDGDDGSSPRTFLVELVRARSGSVLVSKTRLVGITEGVVISRSIACGVWRPRPAVLPMPPQAPKGEGNEQSGYDEYKS